MSTKKYARAAGLVVCCALTLGISSIDSINKYVDAGYDEIYVTQVGPDQAGFLRFYEREILPHFGVEQRVGAGAARAYPGA